MYVATFCKSLDFLHYFFNLEFYHWDGEVGMAELADKPASEPLEVKCQYALVLSMRLKVLCQLFNRRHLGHGMASAAAAQQS